MCEQSLSGVSKEQVTGQYWTLEGLLFPPASNTSPSRHLRVLTVAACYPGKLQGAER